MQLRIAQVIADTEAEGPGRRYALWVQGCTIRCAGCCNPEMFAADKGRVADSADLAAHALSTPGLEGVSILGGEPGEQADAVADFCERTYKVKFPMIEKTSVLEGQASPLFEQLFKITGQRPKWNFHKYLIASDGKTVMSYSSRVAPESGELIAQIEKMLANK